MAALADAAAAAPPPPATVVLVLTNISKPANIKSLALAGARFGAAGVAVVGLPSFDASWAAVHPAVRARLPVLQRCESLGALKAWLGGVALVGVEIDARSEDVTARGFSFGGSIALMLGNEGSGMSKPQLAACDRLVYIPQHGGGTASLNVAIAAALVLHRFRDGPGRSRGADEG